jgi:glycosyltransferase involved in cell wall biosynthesis/GT2 family glycosyltransferase
VTLETITPGHSLGTSRGDIVVAIPVHGARDLFLECLNSVLAWTPEEVPVLVADDASPDPDIRGFLEDLEQAGVLRHNLKYLRHPQNVGFVANANAVFATAAPADVVLINSDCVVSEAWLTGLHDAAYSDDLVATASAMTNHGTVLSVPERNRPAPRLPPEWNADRAAAAVRGAARGIRPGIPTAVGHCVYIRRAALDLVGAFDEAFAPAYGEEVDFSQRCLLAGLRHVAADDVFVFHRGGASLEGSPGSVAQHEHEDIINARYPYYAAAVREAEESSGPLGRAIAGARQALGESTVTIDGRCLGPHVTGTQVHALELIAALARSGGVRLRVLVPTKMGGYARAVLDRTPDIELFDEAEPWRVVRSDIAHRPNQIMSVEDLKLLHELGDRVVITQQDLIAFHNPGYFRSPGAWSEYRDLTRLALGVADRVLFFSQHALRDAVAEDLIDPDDGVVVPIGIDHQLSELTPPPREPRAMHPWVDGDKLVCLGTDFKHKNRLFALRLLDSLRARHGWEGSLVLAGPRVDHGSSAGDEAAFLATRPALREAVVNLPSVDEAEKAWLIEHATALIYPSVHEGFGLIPFEAARSGVPCIFAAQTSLGEVLPPSEARIVPWDPDATADAVIDLLRDPAVRETAVRAVQEAGARFSWDATAPQLEAVYRELVTAPIRAASTLTWRYVTFKEGLGVYDRSLVGPDGELPEDLKRPLLAVLTRRPLRALFFGPVRAFYWLVRMLGRSG